MAQQKALFIPGFRYVPAFFQDLELLGRRAELLSPAKP